MFLIEDLDSEAASKLSTSINYNSNTSSSKLMNNLNNNKSFNISSSYGSSFSEMVSVSGNQIQFSGSSRTADDARSLAVNEPNKSFVLNYDY